MKPLISLYRDAWGQLMLEQEGKHSHVFLKPCFPWSEPERYLSLRDKEGVELTVVDDLNDLDEESREAAQAELKQARFCFEVTAIDSVERDFELRVWKVRTDGGPRRFLTHLDTWPFKLPDGVLILRDLAGDLYRISDPDKLDRKSGKLLWAFRD